MTTTKRESQSRLNRSDRSTDFRLNDETAEDFLRAYQATKNRISRERELEIEKEENKNIVRDILDDPLGSVRDGLQNIVEDRVRDKLESWIPWIAPYATVLEEAQNNQLKIQNAITPEIATDDCGVSVKTLFINYTLIDPNCKPNSGNGTAPFTPPQPSGSWSNRNSLYSPLFNPSNEGKILTLAWKYNGWVDQIRIKATSSGGSIAWNNFNLSDLTPLIGNTIVNVLQISPSNPAPINTTLGFGGISTLEHPSFSQGSFDDVPFPGSGSYPFFDELLSVTTHRRANYRANLRLMGIQNVNTNSGIRRMYNVRVNMRVDISIGVGNFPTFGNFNSSGNFTPFSSEINGIFLQQFFERPPNIEGQNSNGVYGRFTSTYYVIPKITGDPVVEVETVTPPPPPPRKKCECMPNCCPQNNSDLSELKRLVRIVIKEQADQKKLIGLDQFPMEIKATATNKTWIFDLSKRFLNNPIVQVANSKMFRLFERLDVLVELLLPSEIPTIKIDSLVEYIGVVTPQVDDGVKALIGTPLPINLWDTDPTKPGNQTQTVTPKTVFKAIETLANEITLTQRIIGIDKLPAKVPKKWVTADNTYKMMKAVADNLGVKAQFEFLAQLVNIGEQQTEITSLVEFMDWQSDQLDDVLGDWEIEVNIADGDLIEPGEQGTTGYVLNIAQALQKTIEESAAGNISNKALINMSSRVLIELQGIKQELGKSASQVDAIRDYLGFPTVTKVIKIPAHCNIPKPKDPNRPDGEQTKVENLASFLEGTSLPIEVEVYEEKGTYQDILIDLQQAAAITRAKDFQRVGNAGEMAMLLGAVATGYGLLKATGNDGNNGGITKPRDTDTDFDKFIQDIENDHQGTVGRTTETPDNPYGKPKSVRPKIRTLGNTTPPTQ